MHPALRHYSCADTPHERRKHGMPLGSADAVALRAKRERGRSQPSCIFPLAWICGGARVTRSTGLRGVDISHLRLCSPFVLLDSPCGLLLANTLELPRLLLPCVAPLGHFSLTVLTVCRPTAMPIAFWKCLDVCLVLPTQRWLLLPYVPYFPLCAVTPFVLIYCLHSKKPRQFRNRAFLEHKGSLGHTLLAAPSNKYV